MIEIRPVTTIKESRLTEAIANAAWGDEVGVAIPDHLVLILAREAGGVVLMAWDGDKPVGYCLGFLAFSGANKRLKHHSHVAGVVPDYQGRGVGEMLKWEQRDVVLAMGVDHITWTYDPLETQNGRLNIHKLGAVCNTYKQDVYGELSDGLNWGVPTDRFQVDWWLSSDRVLAHKRGERPSKTVADWLALGVVVVNVPLENAGIFHSTPLKNTTFEQQQYLVAVPKYFQRIKEADIALSLAW